MKIDFRKKRFLISLVILICGVLALHPYLNSHPQRELLRAVSGLPSEQSAAVLRTLLLADALVDKGRTSAFDAASQSAVTELLDSVSASAASLKAELAAMPRKSKELSPAAQAAYASLDELLTHFIVTLSTDED